MQFSVAKIFSPPLGLLAFPRDLCQRKLSLVKEIMWVGPADFVLPIV